MLASWVLTLRNVLLPMFCRQCGERILTEENMCFCPACWQQSPRVTRPFCTICGRPHTGAVGFGTASNFPCADCRATQARPFRRMYGAALYQDAVQEAIKLFKFNDRRKLAKPLGAIMADFAQAEIPLDEYHLIVPVPLHRVRRRARGFNQSELLARELLPIFPNARLDLSLYRIRPTRVQSLTATLAQRKANIIGAFAVQGDVLKGKTVLLIDDVVTTGVTTGECARAMARAGAANVDVFAAALVAAGGVQ
ncbi:MAG TPA: double zinc ribbon domain-containing protein [Candidatus Bathyarchaeia archaeon]|nr:double zinc ribbon domain-containing protein [Candidatus Bathyarchaeia archaeon]